MARRSCLPPSVRDPIVRFPSPPEVFHEAAACWVFAATVVAICSSGR